MSSSSRSSISPAAKRRKIVGSTSYGPKPQVLTDKKTIRFTLHNFESLQHECGQGFETGSIKCHGKSFRLNIYPRGRIGCGGFVSCFLVCGEASSNNPISVKLSFHLGPSVSHRFQEGTMTESSFGHGKGINRMIEREKVLSDCLDEDGNWVIDVDIQIRVDKKITWYPSKSILEQSNSFIELLNSPESCSDIALSVGEENTKFHLHKCVLYNKAPGLYELIEDFAKKSDDDFFELPDVTVPIFQLIVDHVYKGILPECTATDENYDDKMKTLLKIATRYQCVLFKLWIESEVIAKLVTNENAADWLSIADSYSCALLKESCMEIYSKYPKEVRASSGWSHVKESPSLLDELLLFKDSGVAVTGGSDTGTDNATDIDYESMSVREQLEEKLSSSSNNLDYLDGTKSMLIQRLKEENP